MMITCFTDHAWRRARERYNVTLAPEDMTAIMALCLSGSSVILRQNPCNAIHSVHYQGVRYVAAVKLRQVIMTFLPPEEYPERRRSLIQHHDDGMPGKPGVPKPYKRQKIRLCDLRRSDFT